MEKERQQNDRTLADGAGDQLPYTNLQVAVGETAILLHPPLDSAGVSTGVERGDASKLTELSPTATCRVGGAACSTSSRPCSSSRRPSTPARATTRSISTRYGTSPHGLSTDLMALFTSDSGAMRLHGHEMAVITSGLCATGAGDHELPAVLPVRRVEHPGPGPGRHWPPCHSPNHALHSLFEWNARKLERGFQQTKPAVLSFAEPRSPSQSRTLLANSRGGCSKLNTQRPRS